FFSNILFHSIIEILIAFWITMIFISILGAGSTLIFAFKCKEKPEFQTEDNLPFIESMKWCFKNKTFLLILVHNFTFYMLTNLLPTMISYMTQFLFNFGSLLPIFIFSAVIFISIFGVMLLISFKRFILRKTVLIGNIAGLAGFLLLFISLDPLFSALSLSLIIYSIVVYGLTINPLISEACDVDELNTGQNRGGAYFGVNALITKAGISIGPVLFIFVMLVFGYVPQSTVQLPSAIFGIRLSSSLLLVPFVLAAVLAIYFLPLGKNEEEYLEFKKKVAKLQEEKRKKYLQKIGETPS
ncbi:MAG: MFS transporter, partial [Candidatus Helarchaeales archaeon]